jgi:holo-[acyl-carrier protein] synthase
MARGGFIRKAFVPEEIEYAHRSYRPAVHLASAFAAREALAKASGLGLAKMGLHEAWVRRDEAGSPCICLSPALEEEFSKKGIRKIWLSISHEGDFAVAVVVLED